MEESYSCPDCAFTANRDLVLQVLRHFFNCTSFRCIQDISCGHNLGLSTSRPQTQQGNSNCSQKNSCYTDKPTKERRDSPVKSAFATANGPIENTDNLYSPRSNTSSSTSTNGFMFQSDNSNRSNTSNKEASSMDLSEHDSEEIVDEQCNTDSTENMQLHTSRNLTLNIPDRQAGPCRIESYFSVKPHKSVLSVACQSSENVTQEKNDSWSAAVSAQNLRMAGFRDSVATDTARSDMLMQVQVKVEPSTEEYGHYSTGAQGESSTEGLHSLTEGLHRQSSHLTVGPAIPSVVGNRDSIQQLRRDAANAGAPTTAGEGVSANSQEQQCTTGAQPMRCPICCHSYKGKRALATHCKVQHPNQPCCTTCWTIFNSMEDLRAHQRSLHHTEETFQCRVCHKTFGYKRNLLVHMKEQHLETGQEFPCMECQKMYRTKRALKEHIRTHRNHRKYTCDVCGKCFTTMPGLQDHYVHIHQSYY